MTEEDGMWCGGGGGGSEMSEDGWMEHQLGTVRDDRLGLAH